MKRSALSRALSAILACIGLLAVPAGASAQDKTPDVQVVKPDPKADDGRSHIDIVIALDTSNSMDGLIDSARQKLWDIVNDLATAKPTPILRVGIVSFGNDGYREAGWTRIDAHLTDDLDTVYERLMGLTTNGGNEYVGRAIKVAVDDMEWRKDKGALKMIFVAGNESADQDREFRSMELAARAINSDIIVNTIFCGNERNGDAQGWRQVAQRADGQFAAIAEDGGAVAVNTPVDKKLLQLNDELNKTYIAYGAQGRAAATRQKASDDSAAGMSQSAAAARTIAKGSALYRNSKWDLVDAYKEGEMNEIADEELPAEMQKMSEKERLAYVKKMERRRAEIQKEIAELKKQRDAYVATEMKKRSKGKKAAFDVAVKKAVRKQAATKNINF